MVNYKRNAVNLPTQLRQMGNLLGAGLQLCKSTNNNYKIAIGLDVSTLFNQNFKNPLQIYTIKCQSSTFFIDFIGRQSGLLQNQYFHAIY